MQKHLYVMPAAHTHLISQANEIQLEAHLGDSWNLQAAISPYENLSIYGAWATTNKSKIKFSYFELLAGLGSGRANTSYDSDDTPKKMFTFPHKIAYLNGKYSRSFLQINIGTKKGWLTGGMAFRFSHVNFNNLKRTIDSNTEIFKNVYKKYFEPIGFLKLGWNRFGIKTQLGFPIRISSKESAFDAYPFHMSLGIYINLGE